MDSRDRKTLERVLKLSEENHRMVKKLYRSWIWGKIITVVYWLIVIGVGFGAYYFLQPYIEGIKDLFSGLTNPVKGATESVIGIF